jgi:hypothetical protein
MCTRSDPWRAGRNRIGTDVTGAMGPGNDGTGVSMVGSSDNTVGGTTPGAGNRIAFNTPAGVAVDQDSVGNSILSNSIESNGGLGIDLGADGVTLNDAGDADTGADDLQNFPVLTGVTLTSVSGTLNSEASQN